jgi:quaternary ammonium compound-resistance protein SugE
MSVAFRALSTDTFGCSVRCLASVNVRGGIVDQPGEQMAWGALVLAGIFEIGWAIGLKYTDGFTRLWPTAATVGAMVISFALLGVAVKAIPVGTAYAVWVGIGAVGTAILGMVLLGEAANAGRVVSLGLVVVGIIGLKLTTPV